MREFVRGFMSGVRRTPRGYFAPAIVMWRLLIAAAEEAGR